MYYIPQPAQMPPEIHPTKWIGDRGVAFLEDAVRLRQPWYLFLSFIHPHSPFSTPSPWHKLYRAPKMPLPTLPPDYINLHTYINRCQNRYKYRDRGIDLNLIRCIKAYYYATISFIDFQIGRVLNTLEKTGMMDDTLVIFTSDHGELLGDYGSFGKRSMHDACARVPLLVRFPERFTAGITCNTSVSLVDIAPTILNATDTYITTHTLDGVDLAEVANGKSKREYVFMQYQNKDKAIYTIITKQWNYAYSAPDNLDFLFDRINDPLETKNFAGEKDAVEGDDWRSYTRFELPSDPDAGLIVQDHPWARINLQGYTD